MGYIDRLNEKPIQNEINEGTYLVGVQRNEEGEDVTVRVTADAIEEFKTKKAEEAAERAVEAANEAAKLNSIIEELEINSEVIKDISTLGSIEKLDNDPEIADTTELLAFKVFCGNKSVWRVLFALYTGEDKTPANTFFVDDNGDILTDENNAIITDEEGV